MIVWSRQSWVSLGKDLLYCSAQPITTVASSPRKGVTPLSPCGTVGFLHRFTQFNYYCLSRQRLHRLTASTRAKQLGLDFALAGRFTEALVCTKAVTST